MTQTKQPPINPERFKARRIEIRAGTEPLAAKQDNEQKQIDASAKKVA